MSEKTLEEKAAEVLRESQALIARIVGLVQENDERMRAAGLDPEKVRALGPSDLDDEHRRQLEAQLKADMEVIERDARHAVDAQDDAGAPKRSRRPQNTI